MSDLIWTDLDEAEKVFDARWAKWLKLRAVPRPAFVAWTYELRVGPDTGGQVVADLRLDRRPGYPLPAQRSLRIAEHFAQAAAAAASGGTYFVRVLLDDGGAA